MAHTSRCETATTDVSRCECSCGGSKHGIANDNGSGGATAGGASDDEVRRIEVSKEDIKERLAFNRKPPEMRNRPARLP